MFKDIFGVERMKVGLHIHTTRSDGRRTPDEVAALYRAAGYDAIAMTDHWAWHCSGELGGLKLISGAEYDIGCADPCGVCGDSCGGVYHIVALGCTEEPAVTHEMTAAEIADAIHRCGGLAVLAHPAWSLNDPAVVADQTFFDATEIYNTVSGVHSSFRPESGAFCDLLACRGVTFPLLATDDAHYYDGTDNTRSFICAHAPDGDIAAAIRRQDFYASQGPQIYLQRDGSHFYVDCTPAETIIFITNTVWARGRVTRGHGLTHAEYTVSSGDGRSDRFVRAEVIDADGNRAWSNYITV